MNKAVVEMNKVRIEGEDDYTVAVTRGLGMGFVQIGVEKPGAEGHIGDPNYSFYATLNEAQAEELLSEIRRACRESFAEV